MGSKQSRIPVQLEKLRKRFDQWRRTHVVRSRLPDELWATAVKMADIYGLHRTARVLGLDYNSLKKRVEQQSDVAAKAKLSDVRFVELPGVGMSAGCCECSVEWEDAAGSKMRVHLKGTTMPDLAGLSRSFWNPS